MSVAACWARVGPQVSTSRLSHLHGVGDFHVRQSEDRRLNRLEVSLTFLNLSVVFSYSNGGPQAAASRHLHGVRCSLTVGRCTEVVGRCRVVHSCLTFQGLPVVSRGGGEALVSSSRLSHHLGWKVADTGGWMVGLAVLVGFLLSTLSPTGFGSSPVSAIWSVFRRF